MSFETFIKSVEETKLLNERDKYLCLADHCTREWEGEIKKKGDSVTIYGLNRPTVWQLQADGTYADGIGTNSLKGKGRDIVQKGLPDAEELTGYEINCPVNQMSVFNFMVGDIDEQQSSVKGILAKSRPKAAQEMAEQQDKYVRDVIAGTANCRVTGDAYASAIKLTSGVAGSGEINILDFIDEVVEQLKYNNVKDSEKVYGECSPAFIRRLKVALRGIDTNNSAIVRGREVTTYNGIEFFSTNIMKKAAGEEYVFLRTGDSVAFFDPLTEMVPYSPEKGFGDAIKGFTLYDAKVVDEKACKWAQISGYAG
jgi:hypothetical protein